jgi:hypothetical protein
MMGDRPHVRNVELCIKRMSEPVHRLLVASAKRRHMSPGDLAAMILGGVLTRGHIDKTLARFREYQLARYDTSTNGRAEERKHSDYAQV